MTRHLLALAAAAALAACDRSSAPDPGLNLAEPNAVAVFRGVASKYPARLHPYIAVASTADNALALADGETNEIIPGPFPLRGLVYPVPDRPTLLAAADLGDGGPDLLVAVSGGDSRLQVIRTWQPDGAVVGEVTLPGDVLAVTALAPAVSGTAQLAAVLSGERVALVSFPRAGAVDPVTAGTIDTSAAQASVRVSAALGFQPVAIARSPATPGRVWVASREDLGGGTSGVAGLDLAAMANGGTPAITRLDALAPTRFVGAAQVRERPAGTPSNLLDATLLDPAAITTLPLVERVYAVLDESGCGLGAPIACGLVALDPGTGTLAPDLLDPAVAGTMTAPFRAPIPIPGPLGLAVSGPPEVGPTSDPRYAVTVMRMASRLGARATTAAAAVPSIDGTVWFVDLTRWEVPSHVLLQSSMGVTATSAQPPAQSPPIPANQWLVLADPSSPGTAIKHDAASALASAVTVTPGYTPAATWTVVREGLLPRLSSRRAVVVGADATGPWVALQSRGGGGDVVRVWDPTLGVQAGDIVVVDPSGLGTCSQFEAVVSSLERPSATAPGGFLRLARRVPGKAAWDRCVDDLAGAGGSAANLLVSIRAGDYVLVRSTGAAAQVAGRPQIDVPFELKWTGESPGTCQLPPAVEWPLAGLAPDCDATCRSDCEALLQRRLARRIGYVPEACTSTTCSGAAARWPSWPDPAGPAIRFTLALEAGTGVTAHRDLSLTITTGEGRSPLRAALPTGVAADARAVTVFDRSPWQAEGGIRFLVAYPAGFVLDASPTESGAVGELK